MKKYFIKKFVDTPYSEIRREAKLQRRAAALGFAPKVLKCTPTTIEMENLNQMCLGDQYGLDVSDLPEYVKEDIVDILRTLYTVAGIEYIDITPYNFIEKDGVVWIIDFGHAREVGEERDEYLEELLETGVLAKWNPDFF